MRVVFLGTPDFAVPSLKAINNSKHKIVAVVTQPDKPVGRRAVVTPSPVKVCAEELGLKVLQYSKISAEGIDDLKSLAADIMVTCAFGQILSEEVLGIAPHGVVNVHASLLPKYRGSAPIQYSVINGDAVTGVTIMQTEKGIDTGDILAVSKVSVGDDETAGDLFDKLSLIGAKLIAETLDKIENGDIVPVKQDDNEATYVKMIKKSDALIDWSKPSRTVNNLIRGMNPWPVAYTVFNGKAIKIYSAKALDKSFDCRPGQVAVANKKLVVGCGVGSLEIVELQPEGGRRMSAKDYLLGRKIAEGDVFDD